MIIPLSNPGLCHTRMEFAYVDYLLYIYITRVIRDGNVWSKKCFRSFVTRNGEVNVKQNFDPGNTLNGEELTWTP